MAFEALINRLIPEGSVMAGNRPNVIDESGNLHPPNYGTDKLSNLLRGLGEYQVQVQQKQDDDRKKAERKTDMYKTLRESGYDPKRAYEAVNKSSFPMEEGGETSNEQITSAKVEVLKAQANKTNAQAKNVQPNKQLLIQRILTKIANNEPLATGEQKVYDEVIRKYGQKSDLDGIVERNKAADINAKPDNPSVIDKIIKKKGDTSNYIPMTDPSGARKKVHPDDVEKALKAGWKKRG